MAYETLTATVSASPSTIRITDTTQKTGRLSWQPPTVPAGTTITSCTLTGIATATMKTGRATIRINGTSVTSGQSFTIALNPNNTVSYATVIAQGTSSAVDGTVSFINLVYTVRYTVNTYTVTFKDYDGTVLKTQTVVYGKAATAPSNPSRTGYTFSGWDNNYTYVTSDRTVTAQYTITRCTVTFRDHDGTVLKTQTVNYGSSATAPSNPSRTGYTFTGWDKAFASITSDLTVTAKYTINTYTVTFKDHDGTVLKTQTVEYGKSATAPSNPSRTGYTFTGWSGSYTNVTQSSTVIAQYAINKYTVTFKDYDGTTLKTQTVEYGKSATAPSNPSRTGYTFIGWSTTFASITADLIVTAKYDINSYFVTFKDHDGTVLRSYTVNYGSAAIAPENPTRTGYTFTGWDNSFNFITADLTVTAQYTINKYTVTFVDYDGTILDTQTVEYSASATAPAAPSRAHYDFVCWDQAFNNITADLTVTAVYVLHQYSVIFKDYDGSTIVAMAVSAGKPASAPPDPMRDGYIFIGWDKDFSNITADLVITAQYEISNTSLRVKESGSWIAVKAVYKKVSGAWTAQPNENLDSLFNTDYAYIKK